MINESVVKESALFISQHSEHVNMGNDEEFSTAAELLDPILNSWKQDGWSDFPLHPSDLNCKEEKAAWVFLIDTLNYAFWTPENQIPYQVTFNGKPYTGYWSLCAAIRNEVSKSHRVLQPSFWANATIEEWAEIFKSDNETPIPFLEWRQKTISEAGRYVISQFNGSVFEMIKAANKSALKLVDMVYHELTSYQDFCDYKGRKVYFLKRAQIFAADLHYAFIGDTGTVADVCTFTDIDKLTMFADYRVPQVLNYLNLIHYDAYLSQELLSNPHFLPGSQLECEIRGYSILAVEKLKSFIKTNNVTSIIIDFVLWTYAKEHSEKMNHIPIHKTSGIFY